MIKDEYNIENKDDNFITISLIKTAVNNVLVSYEKSKDINEKQDSFKGINEKLIRDLVNLINSIKKIEKIYKCIYNSNSFGLFKRNFIYIINQSLNKQNRMFRESKFNSFEFFFGIFILYLRNSINEKKHELSKKIFVTIIRLISENIFPQNFFLLIIEIFINILLIILNSNPDYKFSLSDEPFTLINDIIESFVIVSKMELNNGNNLLLRDVIDIFEKYLITPNFLNINFKSSAIWLKFLENYSFNPLKADEENELSIDKDEEQINENKKDDIIQKKIYSFLINIYLFNIRDEYFQNDIMKKGIINLKYSINTLNYLTHLFKEEEKLQINNASFKIKNGFYLQKDNFLFLSNIRLKVNEFSIIFSFKITNYPKDKDIISILNLYNKTNKSFLHVFIDKNNYLNISYSPDKVWNTFIKIKENTFYLICISYSKVLLLVNSKLGLFINESINEDIIKDENLKGIKIEDTDSCYYYKKKFNNNIDLSKEFFLELGKNNFIGIIGEFLIINKNFTKDNIHHLFNLKENYSKVLSQIYHNYGILNTYDSINWKKDKFGINKLSINEERSINFFKQQFGYEIKLEIMTYKINRFTKSKYFSQNFYNQELTGNIIKPVTSKENNEMNLSLISIISNRSGHTSLNNSGLLSNKNSNSLSNANSFNNSSYSYHKDLYKREKIDLYLNIYKLRYSSVVFFENKGIDYLTFQLHNIFSTVDDEKILRIYLYEIINFIYKIMLLMFDNIIDTSNRQAPKLNDKISIFFLTLLTVLKKKKGNILNNNIVLKLLKILDFFRINQLFIQRNMILSILLEVKYYENEADIMKYPQILKTITSDLNDDSNNDITIINSEILYKILMLDFIFELKEHKLLIKLISSFISKKNNNKDKEEDVINEFINYVLGLKNEKKIYHYLKIIYLNLGKIKKKLLTNEKFLENINLLMEKINHNHCKYCAYNQLLWYLLYEEICIKQSNENYCFHYNPIGFMKKPSIYFIKCIFIQCFSISNENKLKYIKTKSEGTQFILSILKNNNKNNSNLDTKLAQIVEYKKFIPNIKSIIEYLKFLYEEQNESKDENLLNIIKESVSFIMSFLKEICLERKNNLKNLIHENLKDKWSIINTDYLINLNNESEKKAKEIKLIKKYDEFIQELLSFEEIRIFYYIYLSINYKQASEDLKYFVDISINSIFNPFYFYFLSPNIDFNNNIDIKKENDDNENINDYIICHIFNLLETELTKSKLVFDEDKEIILVQNNILLLIYIYQILISNKVEIDDIVEKNIILFLNFLSDNYFLFSKFAFEVNILINDNLKDTQNKKFIIEMVVDILFFLYDHRNYDLKYQYLIKGIFINKKINMKLIDDQIFLESKNQGLCYKFFNGNYFQKVCKGVEVPEILYSLYFLYYLNEKLYKYKNNNIENKDNTKPIQLINEIMYKLFIDIIQIFHNNSQKINYLRKNLINRYPYKIYKSFMQFIFEKYKEKGLTLENLVNHYEKLIAKNAISVERNTYFLEESLLFKSANLDIGINFKNNNSIMETNTWKQPFRNKIQKINLNKIHANYLKGRTRLLNKILGNNKTNNLNIKLIKSKRSKSNIQTQSKKLMSIKINKEKSCEKGKKNLKKYSLENLDGYIPDNQNNSLNNSIEYIQNKIEDIKENENNKESENLDNKIKEEPKLEKINNIHTNELKEEKENNLNQIIGREEEKTRDDISDISEGENIIEEYDIKAKLKSLNIPSRFYRYIFHLSDPNTLKILFNPKEYYIWKKFTLILKDIIYHNKKFEILVKIFNNKFQNQNNEKSSKLKNNKYYLKYPTKLKNFICDDYYRPFIKPDINFFRHKLLQKSHSYLNNNIISNNFSDEDNLCKIKFERILPINYDLRSTKRIVCELINNNGSIYGHIYFNHAFLLFISDNNNDPRNNPNLGKMNEKQEEFYLYSYFLEERLKNKKKFEIMYFSEIKEIFIRRFCLNYIGYEIFMKDNRSHLFNFFNRNNLKKFLKFMSQKLELSYKKQIPNNLPIYSQNENISSLPSINYNISRDVNFTVINDPISLFEKNGYKPKYQKGEISNFKYLLLLNKFSSRSYNDNCQYLIFPLLFMDIERRVKRNLSKVICLNKENNNIDIFKDNYKMSGNHFNTHYSTCGYVLYYLIRLNPFTFGHIKLQSGHFDAPERIFSSLDNYLYAISSSDENRELIPELFFNYEAFLNLNHNYLGYIKTDQILINDFISNEKNGIIEFIINIRQELEKSNIIPWIDNVFGLNQLNENNTNDELINIFPLSSYEQINNFEEKKKLLEKEGKTKKQILQTIKDELCFLSVGITPIQLFKTNHPLRNTATKRLYSFFDGPNNNIISDKIVKSLSHKNLTSFVNSNMNNKYQIFCLANENNNYGMKLIIKSKKNIHILKMYINENSNKSNSIIKLELWKKKQIKIEPLSKICCELYPGIFCFCRYIDNVIQIKSEKQSFLYQYKCIITSLEFFSHNETKNATNNNTIHTNEILFGDEEGYLNLLQIEYEINNKKQNCNLIQDKIIIIKEVKAHNSFIQGILYVKRLGIIISYSEEGQITIINAFSFSIINIIELGEKFSIKDIKISDYDLIYIYCVNYINNKEYIKCYTLNGIKATKLKTDRKINNFFINEEVMVVYENNLIELFNLYDLKNKAIYSINPDIKIFDKEENKKEIENQNNIVFCDFLAKDMKMIIIYQDHNIIIQDIFI